MKDKSFEDSLKELEQIVISMETGNMPLDESLQKYEQGIKLAKACKVRLEHAEKKIEILIKKSDGTFEVEDFEKSEDQKVTDTDNHINKDIENKDNEKSVIAEYKPENRSVDKKNLDRTPEQENNSKDTLSEPKNDNFEDLLF